ncbi:hypothetical protein FB567DRAFT_513539 [Paraphoma chrysanthemicola]|uniref:Uncharacterized protein n=1 Tax=Paraphoma chrysanthemicola TaxID=798071 RepID=A0A8K0W635_9PLEO|nr:hypothetical protein FB567DRAFT_513539 [Paraphoma chrysanthemicola]
MRPMRSPCLHLLGLCFQMKTRWGLRSLDETQNQQHCHGSRTILARSQPQVCDRGRKVWELSSPQTLENAHTPTSRAAAARNAHTNRYQQSRCELVATRINVARY